MTIGLSVCLAVCLSVGMYSANFTIIYACNSAFTATCCQCESTIVHEILCFLNLPFKCD